MKVSFVIPAYNASRYIERCVNSIVCQNLPSYEIIVINDGSRDNTLEILNRLASENDSIIVIDKPNGGVSAARNDGLAQASGDVVMFVDADDYLIDGVLRQFVDKRVDEMPDLVVFKMVMKSKSGVFSESGFSEDRYYESSGLLAYLQENGSLLIGSPCSKLFKTGILRKHAVRFTPGQVLYEDACFNFDYLKHCSSVLLSHHCLYFYDTSGSVSSGFHGEIYIRDFEIYEFQRQRLVEAIYDNWGGELGLKTEILRKLSVDAAFSHLWEMYRLYRSDTKGKYGWFKKLLAFAERHNPEWSNELHSGVPRLVGVAAQASPLLAHWLLSLMFAAERMKKLI